MFNYHMLTPESNPDLSLQQYVINDYMLINTMEFINNDPNYLQNQVHSSIC